MAEEQAKQIGKETEESKIEEVKESEDIEKNEPTQELGEYSIEDARKAREEEKIASWVPRTRLGKMVKNGEIKNIDAILNAGEKILEAEIIDKLVRLKTDLIAIGQSKGKFGGGKKRAWRQTQRKTAEGNVPTFACMAVVGDEGGYVGVGYGKSKETLPAKEKALRDAKINLIRITRGCGSFDCSCKNLHSIPFKVKGKCGSSEMILMPAPKGTGLVIEDECKKILGFAGIKDIYSKTFGQTRTKINLAKACFEALKKTEGQTRKGKGGRGIGKNLSSLR
ncbi:30S ribosomal protein S5 [Candidatus Pacearchaeota archaeon]|nr:30S ribosomal protein S5 [Candidatus Pacearchaeota archaeon]